jgi:hypothetical protein
MRAQFAVLGVALAATLSGCAATTTAAAPAATANPVVSVSPSPMKVIPVATAKAAGGAPTLSNTGSSWLPIVTSLSAYGQWLLANPDPSLVGNVATPGCGMANLLTDQLNGLFASKAYVRTSAPTISSVLGPSPATGTTVVLDVIAGRAAEPVLSVSTKKTITTFAAYPQSALQVTLNLGTDQRWRFCTVEAVGDAGSPDDASVPLV